MRSSLKPSRYTQASQRYSAGPGTKSEAMSVKFRSSEGCRTTGRSTQASYNAPLTLDLKDSSTFDMKSNDQVIELEEAVQLSKAKQAARSKYAQQHLNYFLLHTVCTALCLAFLGWQAFLLKPSIAAKGT